MKLQNLHYKIIQDTDPQSPREWENLGTIAAYHSRYSFDEAKLSRDELTVLLDDPDTLALPLYLYDHSGLAIQTTPFSCAWDSGQLGYIFVTRETIKSHFGIQRPDDETVLKYLADEITTLDQYLTGDVYGYEILDEDDEHIDSCWGFYGEAYAEEEAKAALAHAQARHQAEYDAYQQNLDLAYAGI